MNPPGWYPDPAGTPNSFRWWDGRNWTTATTTTPATTPPPTDAAPQAGPEVPGGTAGGAAQRRRFLVWFAVAGVALLLIIVGVVVVPRLVGSGAEEEVSPPPATPSDSGPESPGPGPDQPAELNCAGGNQNSTGTRSPIYSAGGLQYEAPDDWTFRYDMSQWTWLDDQAVWGTIDLGPEEEDWGAGVALGGVRAENGFTDPETAATSVIDCLGAYGIFNEGGWTPEEVSAEEVEVAGMPGFRAVFQFVGGDQMAYAGYDVVVLVVDTGREGSLGTWMSFAPMNESDIAAQVQAAEESITGN